ncbi:DUF1611 domain-containing protein [Lysobacter sp. K5869]|uniref:DUF1611 domain-containing protein n=1 Tax=Lysobacter sp. K5869 TaxID=2820808 RepID=UPI001C06352A|nr:DUF1611 domain-containing protein [Lysobacter sp. K5869]QWP76241.1 DUF1611 domain-containing protein [Lysobacter sp. K5869]
MPNPAETATPAALASLDLPQPYLLFLGDVEHPAFAKTALGLRDWARELCVGEFALPGAGVSLNLPAMTPAQAHASGARAMVVGVANVGGVIPPAWLPSLLQALDAGLDLIGGLHQRLNDIPELREAAARHGRRLIDVRQPPPGLPVANGRKRGGKRLLTVGTDCALGKKYTALSLTGELRALGVDATFRASGQTGVLIAGRGLPLDAVVADFAAGAAEWLSPDNRAEHWDVIEGQGSLSHPAYAGVSLALLHGSQPDAIVVCHRPGRERMLGYPDYPLPSIEETIALNLALGRRTNPAIRCAGVSLDTSHLDAGQAQALIESERARLRLPVADPIRGGAALRALALSCVAGS